MTRLLPRYGLFSLGLLLVWVSAVPAQSARLPIPRRLTGVWLDLRVDPRGGVRASLHLPFQPPAPEKWQQALASVLNGSLQQVREEKTGNLWTLHVRADAVLSRSDWTIEGDLDLNGLRDRLRRFGMGLLMVSVHHPSADFSECSLEDTARSRDLLNTGYSADLPVTAPIPPIQLRFGFRRDSAWRFLPLTLVLLAPIGLTLWRRRPRPGEEDRFAAWFRYWRFHSWLTVLLWCAWLVAAASLGVVSLASCLLCWTFARGEFVWTTLFLVLPPALTTLACKVLSAPAFARVPEVEWTRGRLLRQGLWMQLGLVGMGVCAGCGVDSLTWNPLSITGLMYLLAMVGLLIVCITAAVISRTRSLRILPQGCLRERLFELAEQMRVRVRQAYRLPSASWRLLNAVGLVDCVHVCAEVLSHLSRREVDALLALELARLWRRRRHALLQFLGIIALILVGGVGIGVLAIFAGWESIWSTLPFVLFVLGAVDLLWRLRQSGQHFTSRLDREALTITGDPEALITALAKLRRLHLLPLIAGEERSAGDNPIAEWQRLHDLADRAGIPPERLHEILDGPGIGEDRYPPLEAAPNLAPGADSRVFSREFKRRAVFRQSWTGLSVEIALPVLLAYLAQTWHGHGVVLVLVYLAGLPLTILLRKVLVYRLAIAASHTLRRGVREKLARDGLHPEDRGGVSVSLSPHGEPRVYESFLIWDPGFLVLSGDRLCYLGDQTRFVLERRHIRDVYLGKGPPGWFTSRRVYVSWWDDERGTGGVFNLTINERSNWWRSAARQAELARRLCDWLKQPAGATEVPPSLRELPAPDLGAVPSESLGKFASGNILLGLLFLRSPFAIGACLLLGLSFDWRDGAAGWYVLGSVALMQLLTVLSFLPYRGRKEDTADKDAPASGSD